MPLVKRGRIVADPYVRVVDDAPVADDVAVILPAARFLADAAELAQRAAPTGVLWPNDRRVAELAPWLDRLALVALAFPSFRDGRAYSQARQLRAAAFAASCAPPAMCCVISFCSSSAPDSIRSR